LRFRFNDGSRTETVAFLWTASLTVVDQIEIIQHQNGITKIEAFVGDSVGSLTSIGSIFGPDGDVTGSSVFTETQSSVIVWIEAGEHHTARRRADRDVHVRMHESHAFGREFVDVGGNVFRRPTETTGRAVGPINSGGLCLQAISTL
jgi:hypothetical protein